MKGKGPGGFVIHLLYSIPNLETTSKFLKSWKLDFFYFGFAVVLWSGRSWSVWASARLISVAFLSTFASMRQLSQLCQFQRSVFHFLAVEAVLSGSLKFSVLRKIKKFENEKRFRLTNSKTSNETNANYFLSNVREKVECRLFSKRRSDRKDCNLEPRNEL